MSAHFCATTRRGGESWPIILAAVIACGYAFGHLTWYLGTPLGQVPVLDERENLALAHAIATGTLPAEPFYRAPGYPLLLATLERCGVSPDRLFAAALFFGAGLHVISSSLVAQIARRWFGLAAAAAAGLLVALNPVFVHFATQASDTTLALTLFLAGFAWIAGALAKTTPHARSHIWLGASVAWAAAALCRPNYLLVWLLLPILAFLHGERESRRLRVVASLGGTLVFFAVALWENRVSGTLTFLPTQGAYNLWAANQPGANGRYYTQRLSLPPALTETNPARAESVLLFQRETGTSVSDLAAANAYWRQRLVNHVIHHPLAWLTLVARKGYALLNNWEQYNNKTFAFHQALSPWLRWNPLGWGILFVLGAMGSVGWAVENPRAAKAFWWISAITALSVILVYVSARFRLPLAALLAIPAGGALTAPRFWRRWSGPRKVAFVMIGLAAAGLTFSTFDHVRDRITYVQDHALLSRAASTVGDDMLAWHEANAALALRPDHPDALRLAVASYFNLLLANSAPRTDEPQWFAAAKRLLFTPGDDIPDLRAVAAVALWRAGETSAALSEWKQLGNAASAIAARRLTHDTTVPTPDATAWEAARHEPLVALAMAQQGATQAQRDLASALFEQPHRTPSR